MVQGTRRCPAAAMIARPVSVPPVKETRWTSGWSTRAWPVTGPRPFTRLTTPVGSPASCRISTNRASAKGVCSDGFRTQVLPKAIAAATFMLASATGAFHGAISAATPTGSRLSIVW